MKKQVMRLPKTLILNNTAEAFITVRNLQPNNSNSRARSKMSLPSLGTQRDGFAFWGEEHPCEPGKSLGAAGD